MNRWKASGRAESILTLEKKPADMNMHSAGHVPRDLARPWSMIGAATAMTATEARFPVVIASGTLAGSAVYSRVVIAFAPHWGSMMTEAMPSGCSGQSPLLRWSCRFLLGPQIPFIHFLVRSVPLDVQPSPVKPWMMQFGYSQQQLQPTIQVF